MGCLGAVYNIDVSNPSNPRQTSSYTLDDFEIEIASPDDFINIPWWYASSVTASDQYAYISGGPYYAEDDSICGLRIFDISQPNKITPAGSLVCKKAANSWAARDILISDSRIYAASGKSYLRVIDVSDPSEPYEVSRTNILGGAWALDRDSQFVYVAGGDGGLYILDFDDPDNLSVHSIIKFDCPVVDVAVSGDAAIVACREGGLFAIDISDRDSPYVKAGYDTGGIVHAVDINNHQVFVADLIQGVLIFEVSGLDT
jgi:hypothetical protein